MLKKVYIHNYKCFVNFEMRFDNINLLLGKNGSGKSTLFEVLFNLQQLICDDKKRVDEIFSSADLPRIGYTSEPIQKFELEVEGNGGLYSYVLELKHDPGRDKVLIWAESLTWNKQPLYKCEPEDSERKTLQLYDDEHREDKGFVYSNRYYSNLADVGVKYTKLNWFKQRIERFFIVQINPFAMVTWFSREETHPNWNLSNYAAWFAHLNNEDRIVVSELEKELAEIFEGFRAFNLPRSGDQRLLNLVFKFAAADKKTVTYRFSEISAGQKVLIALYTLLYCLPETDYTLCIDEPENFLALPEIQPWLNLFYQRCEEHGGQGILISHHPQLINYLASEKGIWFSRDNQVIRVEKITQQADETGLSVAELIARGWIYDQ